MRLEKTKEFLKGLKRYKNNNAVLRKLEDYLRVLQSGNPLPPSSQDHPLHGRMKGSRALSLSGNERLIYKIEGDTITLLSIGSHDIYESEDVRIARRYLESLGYNILRRSTMI